MAKFAQGIFTPTHPEKYVGKNINNITFRSSWELTLMNKCDTHPNILQWSSECMSIPYKNPLTGKNTFYVPDFLIVYIDKNGKTHSEMIEIKPLAQFDMKYAKTRTDMLAVALNMAKFQAAQAFCRKHGIMFRVMSEFDIYGQRGGKK